MGTSGILLQETKNAFKIITKDNKLKSKYRRELCRDVFESTLLKVSSRNLKSVGLIESPRGGGGGTSLYKPYRYVPPHRVGFWGLFGLKTGIHFAHFGLESGMVFEGTTGVYERIYSKEIEICTLKMHLKIFLFAL